jgi:hypothetical protein
MLSTLLAIAIEGRPRMKTTRAKIAAPGGAHLPIDRPIQVRACFDDVFHKASPFVFFKVNQGMKALSECSH